MKKLGWCEAWGKDCVGQISVAENKGPIKTNLKGKSVCFKYFIISKANKMYRSRGPPIFILVEIQLKAFLYYYDWLQVYGVREWNMLV